MIALGHSTYNLIEVDLSSDTGATGETSEETAITSILKSEVSTIFSNCWYLPKKLGKARTISTAAAIIASVSLYFLTKTKERHDAKTQDASETLESDAPKSQRPGTIAQRSQSFNFSLSVRKKSVVKIGKTRTTYDARS